MCMDNHVGKLLILLNVSTVYFIHSSNDNLYVCGDVNIDLPNYDRESNTRYFIDHFLSMFLYPLISK